MRTGLKVGLRSAGVELADRTVVVVDTGPAQGGRSNHAAAMRFRRARYGATVHRCSACGRSEEHTSELQSLMRTSYAVFCLKNKTTICYRQSVILEPQTS